VIRCSHPTHEDNHPNPDIFAPEHSSLSGKVSRLQLARQVSTYVASSSSSSSSSQQKREIHYKGDALKVVAKASDAGNRLDKVIMQYYPDQSRNYIHKLFDLGLVSINGSNIKAKGGYKVRANDVIEFRFIVLESETEFVPEDIPLDVVYEDEHLIVVNKSPNMVVHPGAGNWTSTLVHALAFRYKDLMEMAQQDAEDARKKGEIGEEDDQDIEDGDDSGGGEDEGHEQMGKPMLSATVRPGIVHRLDKDTSGLIIVARHSDALAKMQRLFADRKVKKTYLALTFGNPVNEGCLQSMIDAPIGRHPRDRLRMAIIPIENGGRFARSLVQAVGSCAKSKLHLVKVIIETGRTHQIRVHMQHRKTPIVGDNVYGSGGVNAKYKSSAQRPMLHAYSLEFVHPFTNQLIRLKAKIPDDMVSFVQSSIFSDFGKDPAKYLK